MKVKIGENYRVYWHNRNKTNGFTHGAIYTIDETNNNLVRFKGYNYWHSLNDITLERYCTCEDYYNCCDCGGNDCGCAYCWSCNACEDCLADCD